MMKFLKPYLCLFLFTFLLTGSLPAFAATVDMPITVRIVDCRTFEKSINLCMSERLCCDIAELHRLEEQQSKKKE